MVQVYHPGSTGPNFSAAKWTRSITSAGHLWGFGHMDLGSLGGHLSHRSCHNGGNTESARGGGGGNGSQNTKSASVAYPRITFNELVLCLITLHLPHPH